MQDIFSGIIPFFTGMIPLFYGYIDGRFLAEIKASRRILIIDALEGAADQKAVNHLGPPDIAPF